MKKIILVIILIVILAAALPASAQPKSAPNVIRWQDTCRRPNQIVIKPNPESVYNDVSCYTENFTRLWANTCYEHYQVIYLFTSAGRTVRCVQP